MTAVSEEVTQFCYFIGAQLADLDSLLHRATSQDMDWQDGLTRRQDLAEANQTLKGIRERLDDLLAEQMGTYQRDNVKRHRKKSRRDWQSDDLLRIVLDSRIVDGETGEVESQVDALRAVYGLKGYNASIKELEKRGIDVDEWCVSEERGWTLEVR